MHLLKTLFLTLSVGFVAVSAQTCDGITKGDICCVSECGECGGVGCSDRGGGLTGDDCCTANIYANDVACGSAPCVLSGDSGPTPTPPAPTPPTPTPGSSGTCDGITKGDICCVSECGECGGVGCSDRGGGLTGDDCCTANIYANNVACGSAPCVLSGEPAPSPPTPTLPAPTGGDGSCDGILQGEVCCVAECGTCGGVGCSDRGGGLDGDDCCTANIKSAGVTCGSAPCIVSDNPAPSPTTDVFVCDGPVKGDICCSDGCGACGGSGCGDYPGLTVDDCCTSRIIESGNLCSVTGSGPCVIDGTSPGPTPTPGPVSPGPAPTTPTPPGPSPPSPSGVDSYLITPPTPVMTIPTDPSDCSGGLPTFRYAASTGKVGKGRLYAESEGCFTMSDLYEWRGFVSSGGVLSPKGPIYELDESDDPVTTVDSATPTVTGKWLLEAELYITNGAIFYCKGSSAGGDCDALRIRSNGDDDFYEVRGYGGSLYFEDTVVTSWDTDAKAPQETYEGGRSYLNCVSEFLTGETCTGQAKNDQGECRMDLINTEAAYLGYFASESYGLTWKVRGFCTDLSNHDVFTTTNVYGDIIGSDIHHNYYGHYSYGHQGGVWTDNEMHENWQYGFDPHDDSDYLTIARNKVWGNVNHGIIASKRCNNVEIYENVVYDGGAQAAGIFLHRSSDNAIVRDNVIYNMQDAGIAFLESMNAEIYNNNIDTVKYGIRMSLGSAGNIVYDNVFNACSDYGLYTYEGSDAPTDGVSNGRPSDNLFDDNIISNTAGGVKFKYSDNLVVSNNEFTGTEELEFFDAQGIEWSGNTLPSSGVCTDIVTSDDGNSVPESTIDGSLPGSC